MADLMTFPNTVEEFMDQYKIVDTEQIYTNGAELVPIFRMEQWFEHADVVELEGSKVGKYLSYTTTGIPTIDVVERKKGKWLESKESISRPYMCSNCGCLYDVDTIMGKLCWNFCPNCGAEMESK